MIRQHEVFPASAGSVSAASALDAIYRPQPRHGRLYFHDIPALHLSILQDIWLIFRQHALLKLFLYQQFSLIPYCKGKV